MALTKRQAIIQSRDGKLTIIGSDNGLSPGRRLACRLAGVKPFSEQILEYH